MATKSELLQQAEIIRVQQEEGGNTAELVGSLLKLIINFVTAGDDAEVTARNNAIGVAIEEALSTTIPNESVVGGSLSVAATASGMSFSYRAITRSGNNVNHNFTIPVVTESLAGIITPAQLSELRSSIQQGTSSLLTEISNRTLADQNLQQSIDNGLSALREYVNTQDNSLGDRIDRVQAALDALTNADTTDAIDNFREILDFLAGVKDDETLTGKLDAIRAMITALEAKFAANESLLHLPVKEGWIDDNLGVLIAGTRQPDPEMGTVYEYCTEPIWLPEGTYHVSAGLVDDFYLCKYNNGEFVGKVPLSSSETFTVPGSFSGETFFNIIRLIYRGPAIVHVIGTIEPGVILYGTSGNILAVIDKSKAGLKEFQDLQSDVNVLKGSVNGHDTALQGLRSQISFLSEALLQAEREHHSVRFGAIVTGDVTFAEYVPANFPSDVTVVWCEKAGTFAIRAGQNYYNEDLVDLSDYIDSATHHPYPEKQYILDNSIYLYDANAGELKKIGGSGASSTFNVTNEVPVNGYYSLCDPDNVELSAVHAAWNAKKAVGGLVISFAIAAGIWKTYQYVGRTVTEQNWLNVDNWNDFGSLAAGTEAIVVLNCLLGNSTTTYTLSSAIEALAHHETVTGVQYRKPGLIISYRVGEAKFEAKQFCGQITDFSDLSQWSDFGGGGAAPVATSDTPEVGGTDALSTGGAAHVIPVSGNFEKNDAAGTVNLNFYATDDENQEGDPLFSIENIPMGGGSGSGGTGATINFSFADSTTRYGAAGRQFLLALDIDTEDEIDSIVISNNATKAELKRVVNPQATGAYYLVDVSELFTVAGSMKLAVKVEAGSLSLTKTITLTAVDVTIQSVQTLNYTSDTVLRVGGGSNSINIYKFPNNIGTIDAIIEIYVDGQWRELAREVVMNTATKAVEISPKNLFGDGSYSMVHAAYPIRIHGIDRSSGVVGNYLYTTVFCIENGNTTPLVALQWISDTESVTRKLLETIAVNYAVYDPANTITGEASFSVVNSRTNTRTLLAHVTPNRATTYTLTQRIENVSPTDGSVTLTYEAVSGNCSYPYPLVVTVLGALVNIEETSGVCLDIDLTGRSNSDSDKRIISSFVNAGGETESYELVVTGANYRTNGFVRDSFGTPSYGTPGDIGRMALRIAEDVRGALNFPFFSNQNVERNGAMLQFQFMSKNAANEDAVIMKCFDGNVGFYIDGKCIVFTTVGADPVAAANKVSTSIRANYTPGKVVTVGLVMERAEVSPKNGVALVRLFVDGEECGACQYNTGQSASYSEATFEFDGTNADLYLYGIKAWRTFSGDYIDAFHNYLLQLSDTSSMIEEYEWNNAVMQSQAITAEPTGITNEKVHAESGTKVRPQAAALYESGMAYFVLCANADEIADGLTFADQQDGGNFPSWLDSRTSDKKSKVYCDIHAFFPNRPWQNFIAEHTPVTNQGTTSSGRPIKNIKSKLKNARSMRLMYTREEISAMYGGNETILALYDKAASLIAKRKIQILENSVPTNIITIKVDFSDPGGANNGAFMEMFNNLQRAMGNNYMTPMQVAYNGPYIQNTSIDSIPIAMFRTDTPNPANAYFHAKANWNQDKGDPKLFGFEGSEGYNDHCINYGEFLEIVVTDAQDPINNENRLASKASAYVAEHYEEMDASKLYMFSEYCGEHYRFYRDSKQGQFVEVPAVENYTDFDGTLYHLNGNVSSMDYDDFAVTYRISDGAGYKFYHYQSAGFVNTTGRFYWNSVTNTWTTTGDALNPVQCYELLTYVNMAWMRGVSQPSDMINYAAGGSMTHWTKYFESRYPDDDDLNALYEENRKIPYQLYRLLEFCNRCDYEDGSVDLFRTDAYKYLNPYSLMLYTLATDYDMAVDQRSKNMMIGFCQEKDNSMRAYFNFAYDGDCLWTYDNDCGQTVPLDMDPNSAADETYYAGYGSILFKDTIANGGLCVDSEGTFVSISSVLSAARSAQDMNGVIPFSPAGHEYYWITKRLKKWPKLVSSYDGERKYVNTMAYDSTYLFSLHGLGLHFLSAAFAKRFKLRDGYYGGPSFLSDVALFRGLPNSAQNGIQFTITAAEPGYFTIGVEGTDESRRMTPVHLEAGESHTFNTGITIGSADGSAMYVLGASNVAKIDVSSSTWRTMDFSNFTLLKELIIGGDGYVENQLLNSILTALSLGSMPYLEKVDIVNTSVRSIDLSGSPRLLTLLAHGSCLTQAVLAEGSRITTLSLPATIETFTALSLPNLIYDGLNAAEGIMIPAWSALSRVVIENCPGIDLQSFLDDVVSSQAAYHRIARIRLIANISSNADALLELLHWGVQGIDVNGNNQVKPYFEGLLTLTVIREVSEIEELQEGYDGLTVTTGLQAFINRIREVNGEEGSDMESGLPEISLENIDELALFYYNGESSDDWIADYAEQNS